jgi:hypothetical protein
LCLVADLPGKTPEAATKGLGTAPWPAFTSRLPGKNTTAAIEALALLPTQRAICRVAIEAWTNLHWQIRLPTSANLSHPSPVVTIQLPGKTGRRDDQHPLQHPGLARKLMGDVKSTGLGRDRLRSVDRNNKTTLLLTRRCGTNKSYAKDLSPRMVKLQDVS